MALGSLGRYLAAANGTAANGPLKPSSGNYRRAPDSQHPDDGGAEVGTTKAKRANGEDATRRDLHYFVPSVAPATVVLVADTYYVAIISLTV